MRKTRKKKNQRLMRSIRRTVASLFMVMAIIVAAIPVEQYGSLQAAEETSTKVEELYQDMASDGTTASTKGLESAYKGDTIRIQRITGSDSNLSITEVYEAKKNNNEAMITAYLGNEAGAVTIQPEEAANYEVVDTAYLEAIKELLGEETYKAEYSVSDEITYKNTDLGDIVITKIGTDAKYSESNIQSKGKITTEDTASEFNSFHILGKSITAQEVYENVIPAVLENHQKLLEEYNAVSAERIIRLEQLSEKEELSEEEAAEWQKIAEAVKEENANQESVKNKGLLLENTFLDLCSYDTNENGVPEILEDVIYNRLQDKTGSSLKNDYTLAGGSGFYVLKSRFDDSYLNAGTVTITGIQNHAFYGKNITSVTIPDSVSFIGDAAFAECSRLSQVSFSDSETAKNTKLIIGNFAFYNCTTLTNVSFPDFMEYVFRTGAFSLSSDKGTSGQMKEFAFPANMKQIIEKKSDEEANDYILAGRQNLTTVTMPEILGQNGNGTVPANTFLNCFQLQTVIFPEGASSAAFDSKKLFSSAGNSSGLLRIHGPAVDKNGKQSALKAAAVKAVDASGNYIAFCYEENGTSYIEETQENITLSGNEDSGIMLMAVGDSIDEAVTGTITYTLKAIITNEAAKTATLTEITNISGTGIIAINTVNGYNITSIASNCLNSNTSYFDLEIAGSVTQIEANAFCDNSGLQKVTIGDSVTTIGANAFSGNSRLTTATIGSGVTALGAEAFSNSGLKAVYLGVNLQSIGSKAFAKCGSLTDVYYTEMEFLSDDDEWWSSMTIADDAFENGSHTLTFHGAINPSYSPYVFAKNHETINGTPICYKTDAPLNLVVVKDKGTDKMTLIDYTHYEELSPSALDSFYQPDNYPDLYDSLYAMGDLNQRALIQQTLYMNIPAGIESIDAKAFYTNKKDNSASVVAYLNKTGRAVNKGSSHTTDIQDLYSTYTNSNSAHPGLFSGVFDDSSYIYYTLIGNAVNEWVHTENAPAGNDVLKEITLTGVESLPDYAFESNENLQKVTLGSALSSVGSLPFKDCPALNNIIIQNNPNYLFENMLLMEFPSGTQSNGKLIQCLESRGQGGAYGTPMVNTTTNPSLVNITSVGAEAFAYCKDLIGVDLSDSGVVTIPEGCFKGCERLSSVILPRTTSSIENDAFSGITNKAMRVEILNPQCVISDSVIDGTGDIYITFSGEQYLSDGKLSPCYQSYLLLERKYPNKVEFVELGTTCVVSFVDMDLNSIKSFVVPKDGAVGEPPTAPAVTGYEFVEWKCNVNGTVLTGGDTYSNVTEDRTIVATYKPNSSIVVPDGSTYTLTVSGGTAVTADVTTPQASLTGLTGGTQVTLVYTGTDTFSKWTATASDSTDYSSLLANASSNITTFTMPNANVTVTATTSSSSGGSGGSGGSSATKYNVTVNYGTGSGEYAEGDTVTITANAPTSSSRVFARWSTSNTNVTLASATSNTTTFVMPAASVVVTANYRSNASGGSGGSGSTSESNRYPAGGSSSSSSTTTTTTANNANNTNANTATGTGTQQNTAGQDELYINANGISNTGLGSLLVEGATDNFVTRITESDETRALVEAALINRYGSLDGILYSPLDITLYDASGTNAVQDATGLNITITMPIPDAMIPYGGNVRAAAVEDGSLRDLTPRFTTIDGISCISFVPPHFSPYVIYVDTNHLAAGSTYDATPATGDPIHPKWFLAIGMACMSVLLFVTGDKKRTILYGGKG